MAGGMQPSALSQDATNAYLQSIGVTAGGLTSAPQYAPMQPQYAPAQPQYAPAQQYVAAAPAQQVAFVPMMQPRMVEYVREPYMPAQSMPPAQLYNMVPAPVQYEVKHLNLLLLPYHTRA